MTTNDIDDRKIRFDELNSQILAMSAPGLPDKAAQLGLLWKVVKDELWRVEWDEVTKWLNDLVEKGVKKPTTYYDDMELIRKYAPLVGEGVAVKLAAEFKAPAKELKKAIDFKETGGRNAGFDPSITEIGKRFFNDLDDVKPYIEELVQMPMRQALSKVKQDLGITTAAFTNLWTDEGQGITPATTLVGEVEASSGDEITQHSIRIIIQEGTPDDVVEAIGKKLIPRFRLPKRNEIHKLVTQFEGGQMQDTQSEPTNMKDARERIARLIATRRGQPAFRYSLIETYGSRCAISGCDAVAALEAAHIIPYSKTAFSGLSNGLLLRADLHTLFDLGLIAIDSATMKVLIHRDLDGTTYSEFAGKLLRLPERLEDRPSKEALDGHRKGCGL
jgi:hypothetical protein